MQSLNENIVLNKNNRGYWRRLIKDHNPEVKSLAMKMLFKQGAISTDELLTILKNEERPTVRLQAFNLITKKYDHNLLPAIKIGIRDNYELLRRLATIEASANLSPELLDMMIEEYLSPGVSQRVYFQLKEGISNFKKDDIIVAFDKIASSKNNQWYSDKKRERDNFLYSLGRSEKEFGELNCDTIPAKSKRFTITALRNSNNTAHMQELYKFLKESADDDLRVLLAEAFAWYTRSWKRDEIVAVCTELASVEKSENVKKELNRTINRLKY